jgi:hypothetical protein
MSFLSVGAVLGTGGSSVKQHTPLNTEWPIEDQIRWAELNLDLLVSNPKRADITKSLPNRKDLEVWLLHKRDGLSLRQLARRFYGSVDAKSISGYAVPLSVRRKGITVRPNSSECRRARSVL